MNEKNKLIYIIFVSVVGFIAVISVPVSMKLYGWIGLFIPLFLVFILMFLKIILDNKNKEY